MSEEQIEDTFEHLTEAPVATEKEAEMEAAAEALAESDGFPAELADGTIVRIVDKDGPYSVDADGNKYVADSVHGYIVPAEAA